jgi:hypothetical protein
MKDVPTVFVGCFTVGAKAMDSAITNDFLRRG